MRGSQFRVVVLDYPKLHLENEETKLILGDMIQAKQLAFARTSESYVSLDGHDMIGTHFMVYDTFALYKPKLVMAIRNTYEHRAKKHNLTLPVENYISSTTAEMQNKFKVFREQKKLLVDCNAWFVDPDYGYSKTGFPLSDLAFFNVSTFILRKGFDHWVGAINERYRTSRWVEKTANYERGLVFTHPKVPDPHTFCMIQNFNFDWLKEGWRNYKDLMINRYELAPKPSETERLTDLESTMNYYFKKSPAHVAA